ncbi:hypothetical protein [Pedobacter sp.]|uniref:hypothetical protein n=1 Tax=Pedobacter sp. TaxID=1411316 RepID=UPI003D7F5145
MKHVILLLAFLGLMIKGKAQHPPIFEGLRIDSTNFSLYDLPISLVKYTFREPNINFLCIHDDEDTGVKAAFEYIKFSGGSIIDCQYGGARNFLFYYNEEEFQTDPNSIYSNTGIIKGLEKYGRADREVVKNLKELSNTILKKYSEKDPAYFFTLHNNADGGFGISSYLQGYELESYADSLHINFQMDNDDLVIVTDLALFNRLKLDNINVVLQSVDAPDDGTLSVYSMKKNIPYINVEVQHGHFDENLRLIKIATKALLETYPNIKHTSTQ